MHSLRRAAPVARRYSIKCGFLGAGDISNLHAEGLRDEHSPGTLVGLWSRENCDVVTDPDAVAAAYGCARFRSPAELVDASDAVFVLTNMESHAELAIAAMDAGKHVLVEKPVASTLDELEAMKAAAARNDVVLFPGHNYIYEPWFLRTKELAERGDLGDISCVYITYNVRHPEDVCARSSMQGVMRQIMTHHAYSLLYLMGAPSRVSAFEASVDTSLVDKENLAMVTMSMENGGLAHLQANFSCDVHGSDPWSFYVKVLGTKGSARYSYNDHVVNAKHIVHSHTYVPYPFTIRAEGRFFLEECVGRGRPPLSTIDDAITCQRVIEAAEASIAESRHVPI